MTINQRLSYMEGYADVMSGICFFRCGLWYAIGAFMALCRISANLDRGRMSS